MAKGKGKFKAKKTVKEAPKLQCFTLQEDEETRCSEPPIRGDRCRVHHEQYCKMTKRYKDASKIVDEILGGSSIPTKTEIAGYKNFRVALDKARWMRQYLEAIRVEKTGREIHQRRFFKKVDDGHKIRVKLLAKKMIAAVEILDAVQARAFDIHIANHPGYEWLKEAQTSAQASSSIDMDLADNLPSAVDRLALTNARSQSDKPTKPSSAGSEEDDLIEMEMEMRADKTKYRPIFDILLEREAWVKITGATIDNPDQNRFVSIQYNTLLQYARRIIFHDPVLYLKALDKVSFKDLILDPDFSADDVARFGVLFFQQMGFALPWWKDATVEALAMSAPTGQNGNAANVGNPKDRFPIVGGWIFNVSHKGTMTNEAWWHFLKSLEPPANIENRFMRVCNNYDDLHAFLSFGALGLVEPPSSCTRTSISGHDSQASRKHLSLCGVVIADMVSCERPLALSGHLAPTTTRARRHGCITWAEIEGRAYLFGAIRNEPEDEFTQAFLEELRLRPDLYHVITRSETDPGRKVETFPDEIFPQVRSRTFEAPPASPDNIPCGPANWAIQRSAMDVLYSTKPPLLGYLNDTAVNNKWGQFFRFKKFPVKYILILDPTPRRHDHHLVRLVSWAALRARGLAKGDYSPREYARASNVLFKRHAFERLDWMPQGYGGWGTTEMRESDCE